MEFELDIVRNADCAVRDAFFRTVVKETVSRAGNPSLSASRAVSLGIALVSDEEIARLNGEYRGKSFPTDVLSFPANEEEAIILDGSGRAFIGDLVISPSFVLRAAKEDGVTPEREFAYILSHGVLHLLGYDHSDGMFALQDAVTDAVAVATLPIRVYNDGAVCPTGRRDIFSMKRFARSFQHALRGIRHAFSHERNFRIETFLGVATLLASFLFPLSATERAAVFLTIGIVLALEILNSAVEWLMDVLQPEYHDSVKAVKDLAAAAVLVTSVFAVLVGAIIFFPHLIRYFP